jgi:hypothetical protein
MLAYKFLNKVSNAQETWCGDFVDANRAASLAALFATAIIITVNLMLRRMLSVLVKFECFENSTEETISFSLKTFLAQYINTGLLSLLIYGYLQRLGGQSIGAQGGDYFKLGAFAGNNSDFDAGWYAAVGASLIFTMILFTIGTQYQSINRMMFMWILRCFDRFTGHIFDKQGQVDIFNDNVTRCNLQEDLDNLYMSSKNDFPFEVQYGSLLTVLFINMTYRCITNMKSIRLMALTIPCMYQFCYAIDECCLSREPHHLICDEQALTTPLLPSSSGIQRRLTQGHYLPHARCRLCALLRRHLDVHQHRLLQPHICRQRRSRQLFFPQQQQHSPDARIHSFMGLVDACFITNVLLSFTCFVCFE